MNILIQKLHYKINDYNNEAKIVIFPFVFAWYSDAEVGQPVKKQ